MEKWVKCLGVVVLAGLLAASSAVAGPKKTVKGPVAGEDDYRSAIGYTVAVMEHSKALSRLTKTKGAFNAELAREHANEAVRNASMASRHVGAFVSTTGAGNVPVSATGGPGLQDAEANLSRSASMLDEQAKAGASDRAALAAAATSVYLAAKDQLVAAKASGKAMGIAAATPPRQPGQKSRKPKKAPADSGATAKAKK